MPDITMCMSKDCPKKNECYRSMAKPDIYQSYADYGKICLENDYKYFWETIVQKKKNKSIDMNFKFFLENYREYIRGKE